MRERRQFAPGADKLRGLEFDAGQILRVMLDLVERGLVLAGGTAIVAAVLYDLLLSVVVPRPSPGNRRISNLVLRNAWPAWRSIGFRVRAERRESMLGSFAPGIVIALLVIWVVLLTFGYAMILWAIREQLHPPPNGFGTALYFSGVALLTIGFGDIVPTSFASRLVVLVEAGTGLGTVALVISMLFALFSTFQRREARVVTLDQAAGAPPSGVLLLETARRLNMPELLDHTFEEWRVWSADVLDSHLAYPVLNYFRSSHDYESWISALGAVLDASTLLLTTIDGERIGPAKLLFGVGSHLVEDLSHFYGFDHTHDPLVEEFEFVEACRRLEAAGYRVGSPDLAWERFSELRATYAGALNEMARYWAIPPAQWIGDRSLLRLSHPFRARHA